MKWEMEADEMEAVLEKILELHDKLSDAIHSVSRAHFLKSVKNPRIFDEFHRSQKKRSADDLNQKSEPGFVFVKEYPTDEDDSAVHEARSLYAIRTALENLEDQIQSFHIVQTQQRAERDASMARIEQSCTMLSMRLAEHQGKKYKLIEDAKALVGNVQNTSQFVALDETFLQQLRGERRNPLVNFFLSTVSFVSKSLKLDHTAGIVGNAALIAISMLAFMSMNQGRSTYYNETRKGSHVQVQTSGGHSKVLDVLLARG